MSEDRTLLFNIVQVESRIARQWSTEPDRFFSVINEKDRIGGTGFRRTNGDVEILTLDLYLFTDYIRECSDNNDTFVCLNQRGPTTGVVGEWSNYLCGPRNNFEEVLSITGSGNLFFRRTL